MVQLSVLLEVGGQRMKSETIFSIKGPNGRATVQRIIYPTGTRRYVVKLQTSGAGLRLSRVISAGSTPVLEEAKARARALATQVTP